MNSLRSIEGVKQLVSPGHGGTIRLWRTQNWQEERTITSDKGGARRLVISPDERRAALSLAGHIQFWDTESWRRGQDLEIGAKAVGGLGFSLDGVWFAIGGADGKTRAWSTS